MISGTGQMGELLVSFQLIVKKAPDQILENPRDIRPNLR